MFAPWWKSGPLGPRLGCQKDGALAPASFWKEPHHPRQVMAKHPPQGQKSRSNNVVILSGARTSLREVLAKQKDPYSLNQLAPNLIYARAEAAGRRDPDGPPLAGRY